MYTSGTGWALSVPKPWAENLANGRTKFRVLVNELDKNRLFVTSSEDYSSAETRPRRYESEFDNPLRMRSELCGAYMRGDLAYGLSIPWQHKDTITAYRETVGTLWGAVETTDSDHPDDHLLEFRDVGEYNIKARLRDSAVRIGSMFESNRQLLLDFRDKTFVDERIKSVEHHESWLDALPFYLKRVLNKSLEDDSLLVKIGIGSRKNVIYYESIVNNIERLGDLQKEVANTVGRLSTEYNSAGGKLDLSRLVDYLDVTKGIVTTAFKVLHDEGEVPKWKRTLDPVTGIEHIESLYDMTKERDLTKWIDEHKQYVRYLATLQSRIWGMVGNAENMMESKLNILEDSESPSS